MRVFDTHSSTYWTAYTDACKTHYTISVYTTVFLKMNPRLRNMQKTPKLKIEILIQKMCIQLVYVVNYNAWCQKKRKTNNVVYFNIMHFPDTWRLRFSVTGAAFLVINPYRTNVENRVSS